MTEMTLKRLIELSGVDMASPKVTILLESSQQAVKLVDEIDDVVQSKIDEIDRKYVTLEEFDSMIHRNSEFGGLVTELGKVIGHEKATKLTFDLIADYYNGN